MIAPLLFWRVMAWIGAGLCGIVGVGRQAKLGWQDKSGGVGWGGDRQNYWTLSDVGANLTTSAFRGTDAIVPFRTTSPGWCRPIP